jgi:hypothetical protein
MKEDILEQLVEDWLQSQGYFTRANVKFKPRIDHPDFRSGRDSVASDIDVVGWHPKRTGVDAVFVVSCKSWQDGFSIRDMTNALLKSRDKLIGNKEAWKHFRELVEPRWTEALLQAVEEKTGQRVFTYITAVTRLHDPERRILWEENADFKAALGANPIKIITLAEMLQSIFSQLGTSVESSQFSRTLQLIKAAGLQVELAGVDSRRKSTRGRKRRPYAQYAGQFRVPDDFDAPLPEEIIADFEGRE